MPGGISNASSAVGNVSLLNGQIQLAGKTLIWVRTGATNGAVSMHVVTAGKTFYLIYAQLKYIATAGNQEAQLYAPNNAHTILEMTSKITATYYTQDTDHQEIAFPHPIPLAAGVNILVRSTAATIDARASIMGWEE